MKPSIFRMDLYTRKRKILPLPSLPFLHLSIPLSVYVFVGIVCVSMYL